MNLIYRGCEKEDRNGIAEILYKTGFMGEDLTDKGLFRDKKLFSLINTDGYVRYETDKGFVAQDTDSGKILGYIIGTDNTLAYEKVFIYRMYLRIATRLLFVTSWLYPESFKIVFYWFFAYETKSIEYLYNEYPAHLHINIMPGCQRLGIGEKLLKLFVENMDAMGVPGIHLGTSNFNHKALPFYKKNGFAVVFERTNRFWPKVDGQVSMIFGRKLKKA